MRRLWIVGAAVLAAGLALTGPAFGAINSNTFADTAEIGAGGERVRARAFIRCTTPGTVQIQATLTQDNAFGEGETERIRCTGERQRIPIVITAAEGTEFETGAAELCAVAINRVSGDVVDARHWCENVTLVDRR